MQYFVTVKVNILEVGESCHLEMQYFVTGKVNILAVGESCQLEIQYFVTVKSQYTRNRGELSVKIYKFILLLMLKYHNKNTLTC